MIVPPAASTEAPDDPIQCKFLDYHHAHPEVYEELARLSAYAFSHGQRHLGVKLLIERLRWTMHIEKGDEEFKINNVFSSRYARLLLENENLPDDFFELRVLAYERK